MVTKFFDVINELQPEERAYRLSIHAMGHFANAAKIHLSPPYFTQIFTHLMNCVRKFFLIEGDDNDERFEHLPYCVQTLSSFLWNMDTPRTCDIDILCGAVVLVVRVYPFLPISLHGTTLDAVLMSVYHAHVAGAHSLQHNVHAIVYGSMIWSCSRTLAVYAHGAKETNTDQMQTYKDYLPFWLSVIKDAPTIYERLEVDACVACQIHDLFCNEIFTIALVITNKLNLHTRCRDGGAALTDPGVALEPINAHDFHLFLNVVDMYVDLIDDAGSVFTRYALSFLKHNVRAATQHPLVSGFYKLVAAALRACDKLDIFEGVDGLAYLDTVSAFVRTTLSMLHRHKYDLKAACLQVIIAAPVCTIRELLPQIVPAFISLFAMGRTDLELAIVGVDTLLRWNRALSHKEMKDFLLHVLPCFDTYLSSKSILGECDTLNVGQSIRSSGDVRTLGKHKVITVVESQLFDLQKKILSFLADIDVELCSAVVRTAIIDPPNWGWLEHLKLTLPCAGMKLDVDIEKIIPRVLELALYCGEPKTRAAACEVFHSVIILVLGTGE